MTHLIRLSLPLLLLAASGCTDIDSGGGTISSSSHGAVLKHVVLEGGRVGAAAEDGTTAWIDADGALEIDGRALVLSPDQRTLSRQYHADATAIRAQGLALGKEGVKLAGNAVGTVVSGLLAGDPDRIGSTIEAEAEAIEAQAGQLCAGIRRLQSAQDALAGAVPEFRPHATLSIEIDADCRDLEVAAD